VFSVLFAAERFAAGLLRLMRERVPLESFATERDGHRHAGLSLPLSQP
jgi:hypothetical protein